MEEIWRTKICVNGVIIHGGKMLFLKRNFPPLNWCLPGGAAHFKENLEAAMRREIWEETGLRTGEVVPLSTWQGISKKDGNHSHILAINYLCESDGNQLRLSPEHSDFVWILLAELPAFQGQTSFDLNQLLRDISRVR
jgi:ADP-ribose pyrophosphatase YjhB (NUDIX family)